jgi:ring-1,2-phenylacetyl-CoA epoxidase subunit PaaA
MSTFTDRIDARDFAKMPKEYQDLLVRVLTIQADCEIGGPHIYLGKWVLAAPTIEDQLVLAKTAAEEVDHARKVIYLLRELGIDGSHVLFRTKEERAVDAFRMDMPTWADVAVFGFLIDRVGRYQLEEFVEGSYQPLDRALPQILHEERGHVSYGTTKLKDIVRTPEGKIQAQAAINRWYPRALDMFGQTESRRSELYVNWGLKRRTNGQARAEYSAEVDPLIRNLGLELPDPLEGRKYL